MYIHIQLCVYVIIHFLCVAVNKICNKIIQNFICDFCVIIIMLNTQLAFLPCDYKNDAV